MKITAADIQGAKTEKGGFSKKQVVMGQRLTGVKKGWKSKLIGMDLCEGTWDKFSQASKRTKAKSAKPKNVNKMTVKKDQFWKPQVKDIPAPKIIKGPKKKKTTKSNGNHKEFYLSPEWRKLRVRVLEKYECKCMMCGRSPIDHGIVIHVDHIKPRSKHPKLELEISNMQLLCEDCNLGKSNRYQTDWRPDSNELDREIMAEMPVTMDNY